MSKKLLITGASGFIGSFLVEEGLRNGYTVYAGVRPGSNRRYLQQESLRFFPLHLSSPELMERELKLFNQTEGGFDYIIHNAGITHAHRKEDFHIVNDRYTRHLANAIVAAGRLPEKFFFISSLAAGGPGEPPLLHKAGLPAPQHAEPRPSPAARPIRLSDPDRPISAYAVSKLSAENYLQSLPGFPYIIIRPTAVYGPRDRDFLSLFRLLAKGIEPYMGRRNQQISLIYVRDLAAAVIKLLGKGPIRTSWLVSDGNIYTKEDLGRTIRILLNKPTVKIRVPLALMQTTVYCMEKICSPFGRKPFLNREKLSEMTAPNWSCDSRECWQELGIRPLYSLRAGLQETAEWYKENGWLIP